MAGSRPTREESQKYGVVPYSGGNNGSIKDAANTGSGNKYSSTSNTIPSAPAGASYPNVAPTQKSGTNYPSVPPTQKSAGNDQLWQNNGAPPSWPNNQQGVPMNGYNGQSQQTGGNGKTNQQPQVPNWQQGSLDTKNVQQGIPVNPSSYQDKGNPQTGGGYIQGTQPGTQTLPNSQAPQNGNVYGSQNDNWHPATQGGLITQRSGTKGPIPKGDYVYYDGNGNQVHPSRGPEVGVEGSNSERHFHHHYYYSQSTSQPQPQPQAQVGYPYDKRLEERKKRRPGAAALAAALITCWACTCCCHAPCGW